jgi:Membrane proteins related to metalloendopeptidases
MKKGKKRCICGALCVLLAGCLAGMAGMSGRVQASGLTNDLIKEKEAEISDAKEMKKQLQSSLTDVKKIKEELEASKENLRQYVMQLDGELKTIQEKIAELKGKITEKEEEIAQTEVELEGAVQDQENQYEAMKKRIKFMYEKGDNLYMELIFASESFGDMLNKAEYIEMLSAYDREMLDRYVETRKLIELYMEQLEADKEYLEEAKAGVEKEEASLNSLIDEKTKTIEQMSRDIETKTAAIAEYEADIAEQNETIAMLEKIVAEEKARLEEANRIRYDGGMFSWPAPSYTRISDDYGNRVHPILGVNQFHNGIDLAAPGGSPILAAYNGKVVAADYSGSMGNYIMIDHGDGLYTIYMHASALYVSKGASVSKGQKIAAVGSTGRSTGNHLHFSVRLNGNYVSPWNYISK